MKQKHKRGLFLLGASFVVLSAVASVMPDRDNPHAPRQELQTDGSQWTITVTEAGNSRLATAVVYPVNLYYLKKKTPLMFTGIGLSTGLGAPGKYEPWRAVSFIAAPGVFIDGSGDVLLGIDGAPDVAIRTVVAEDGRTATAIGAGVLYDVLAAKTVKVTLKIDTGEWISNTFNVGGVGKYTRL